MGHELATHRIDPDRAGEDAGVGHEQAGGVVKLAIARGHAAVTVIAHAAGAHDVHRQKLHLLLGDVALEQRDIRSFSPEDALFRGARYVVHFAGIGDIVPSIERPLDYMRANVSGTLAVLEAARSARVKKLVYAASSSCYGLASELPTTEAAPIQTEYPYALSKYLGELAVMHWAKVYGP